MCPQADIWHNMWVTTGFPLRYETEIYGTQTYDICMHRTWRLAIGAIPATDYQKISPKYKMPHPQLPAHKHRRQLRAQGRANQTGDSQLPDGDLGHDLINR